MRGTKQTDYDVSPCKVLHWTVICCLPNFPQTVKLKPLRLPGIWPSELWQQYSASPCSRLSSSSSTSFRPNWAAWLSRRRGGIWPQNSLSSQTMSGFVYQCPPAFARHFVSALGSLHHPAHLMGPLRTEVQPLWFFLQKDLRVTVKCVCSLKERRTTTQTLSR